MRCSVVVHRAEEVQDGRQPIGLDKPGHEAVGLSAQSDLQTVQLPRTRAHLITVQGEVQLKIQNSTERELSKGIMDYSLMMFVCTASDEDGPYGPVSTRTGLVCHACRGLLQNWVLYVPKNSILLCFVFPL